VSSLRGMGTRTAAAQAQRQGIPDALIGLSGTREVHAHPPHRMMPRPARSTRVLALANLQSIMLMLCKRLFQHRGMVLLCCSTRVCQPLCNGWSNHARILGISHQRAGHLGMVPSAMLYIMQGLSLAWDGKCSKHATCQQHPQLPTSSGGSAWALPGSPLIGTLCNMLAEPSVECVLQFALLALTHTWAVPHRCSPTCLQTPPYP
jgi:hypothetical protein